MVHNLDLSSPRCIDKNVVSWGDIWAHHNSFNGMPAQKETYVQAASMTYVLQPVLWLLAGTLLAGKAEP